MTVNHRRRIQRESRLVVRGGCDGVEQCIIFSDAERNCTISPDSLVGRATHGQVVPDRRNGIPQLYHCRSNRKERVPIKGLHRSEPASGIKRGKSCHNSYLVVFIVLHCLFNPSRRDCTIRVREEDDLASGCFNAVCDRICFSAKIAFFGALSNDTEPRTQFRVAVHYLPGTVH